MRDLDVSLFRVLAAVAERRSMTAGAKSLNLTQGAVSQKIARLEALAGGRLVTRERRGLGLTPAGERLLGKARHLLALNDEIWSDLNGDAVEGPVRLGLPVDLIGTCFAPVLKGFVEAFPKVELRLDCGASADLRLRLGDGRLDVAVLEEPSAGATGETLAVDRLVWVGAVGGTAHQRRPLPVSLVSEACCFRGDVLAALKDAGLPARTVFENGGLDATVATVRMDIAVSAWLTSSVPADLCALGADAGLPGLPSYAITLHRSGRASGSAASELVRHIRDGFARPRGLRVEPRAGRGAARHRDA